jgi:hypothetical protein
VEATNEQNKIMFRLHQRVKDLKAQLAEQRQMYEQAVKDHSKTCPVCKGSGTCATHGQIGYLEHVISALKAELEKYKKLTEKSDDISDCPTCGRSYYESDEITKLKAELEDLRTYCLLTFGESHPEIKKCPHEIEAEQLKADLDKWKTACEDRAKDHPIGALYVEEVRQLKSKIEGNGGYKDLIKGLNLHIHNLEAENEKLNDLITRLRECAYNNFVAFHDHNATSSKELKEQFNKWLEAVEETAPGMHQKEITDLKAKLEENEKEITRVMQVGNQLKHANVELEKKLEQARESLKGVLRVYKKGRCPQCEKDMGFLRAIHGYSISLQGLVAHPAHFGCECYLEKEAWEKAKQMLERLK